MYKYVCVMGKIEYIEKSNVTINDGTDTVNCSFDTVNNHIEVTYKLSAT